MEFEGTMHIALTIYEQRLGTILRRHSVNEVNKCLPVCSMLVSDSLSTRLALFGL